MSRGLTKVDLTPTSQNEIKDYQEEKSEAQNLFGYMMNPYPLDKEAKMRYGYYDREKRKTIVKYISAVGLDVIRRNDSCFHPVNWRELYIREGYDNDTVVHLCKLEGYRRAKETVTYKRWKNQEGTAYDVVTYRTWRPEHILKGLGLKFNNSGTSVQAA